MKIRMCRYILTMTVAFSSVACGDYKIVWSTIDNGGGVSFTGSLSIVGTIGQADVGVATGQGYMLSSGFWAAHFLGEGQLGYKVVWYSVDGGGGRSSVGALTLVGTIGQSDAGLMSVDSLNLEGGFWPGGPLCFVNFSDFAVFADYWLESGDDLPADLDGNGIVDSDDLKLFVDNWLCVCPYNWPL